MLVIKDDGQDNWRKMMTQVPLKSTIVDDHGALVSWALRRLHVPPALHEDARQGGSLGLLVALERFDPERGSFRSFAGSHVLQEVRTAMGWHRRRPVTLVSLDAEEVQARVQQDEDGYVSVDEADARQAAAAFIDNLEPTDQHIVRRLYGDGATQTEIAAELGTHKKAISRRVARLHDEARGALAVFAPAA